MTGLGNLPLLGGLFAALLVVVFFLRNASKKQGKAEGLDQARQEHNAEVNKANEVVVAENAAIVKEVEKTHEVRDRIDADPAYAQRVQDRFTRPD
jgi:hypothetical protein